MYEIKYVILLIIDDVRYDQFYQFINEGILPNIKSLIPNSIYGKSITTFPSITLPAHISIMTGLYQDSYTVPSIHWYDRINKKIKNYSNNLQAFEIYKDIGGVNTIFEKIEDGTCNIFEPIHRGATYNYPNKIKAIIKYLYFKYLGDIYKSNEIIPNRILKVFKNPKKYLKNYSEPPIFTAAWFPVTDLVMHNCGSNSEYYKNSLVSVDKSIGMLIDGLREFGYLEETMLVITADHGNYSAQELYNPQPDLAKFDLYPLKPGKKGDYDIADGSVLGFYFSGDNDPNFKTKSELENYKGKINVIEAVKKIKGIKWIAYRDDSNTYTKGTIIMERKIGEKWEKAYIEFFNNKTKYVIDNIDILNYYNNENKPEWLDPSRFYTMNEWLEYTHNIDFPMFPDQIFRNFQNPNSCDLFASSMAEIVYNSVHGKVKTSYHVHAHDVALKCSMQVPLLFYNTNFDEKKIEYSKIIDIVPTILKILNKNIPRQLNGGILID